MRAAGNSRPHGAIVALACGALLMSLRIAAPCNAEDASHGRESNRALIEQALAPSRLGLRRSAVAHQLLFIRSHWVRMPLPMLLHHLWRKALKSKAPTSSIQETPG